MVQIAAIAIPCGIQMKNMCLTIVWHTIFIEIHHLTISKNRAETDQRKCFQPQPKQSDANVDFFNMKFPVNKCSNNFIWQCSKYL